jgi:pyrroline-5-carboxylate reductase
MARAIADALVSPASAYLLKKAGYKVRLGAYDTDAAKLAGIGPVTAYESAARLLEESEAVFLAVKPQAAPEALSGLDFSEKTVISVMAGVDLAALSRLTGGGVSCIVRTMPNMNARVSAAFTAYCAVDLDADSEHMIRALLGTFGTARRLDEKQMDIATAIGGSGPAFVFEFMDALIGAGIEGGLSPALAKEMAVQTVIGSACLLESGDTSADALVRAICSKGGTTIEGITHLRDRAFSQTVKTAVEKAAARAKALAAGYEAG